MRLIELTQLTLVSPHQNPAESGSAGFCTKERQMFRPKQTNSCFMSEFFSRSLQTPEKYPRIYDPSDRKDQREQIPFDLSSTPHLSLSPFLSPHLLSTHLLSSSPLFTSSPSLLSSPRLLSTHLVSLSPPLLSSSPFLTLSPLLLSLFQCEMMLWSFDDLPRFSSFPPLLTSQVGGAKAENWTD